MEKYCGTRFAFENRKTGEAVKIYTNNMMTWLIPYTELITNPDNGLTHYEEREKVVRWEVLIKDYRPLDMKGKDFVKFCVRKMLDAYREKIAVSEKLLNEI
jgi:hypothetical protein